MKEFILKQNPTATMCNYYKYYMNVVYVLINVGVNSSHYFLRVWEEEVAHTHAFPRMYTCEKNCSI